MTERARRLAALAAIPRPGAAFERPAQRDVRARVEAAAGERQADLYLYDVIGGWGIWADELVPELAALDVDHIAVHLNSPGGDYFDGVAIANTLAAHSARVTMHVEGMAASAASVIAMAGDEIVMHPGSRMMIHDALCMTIGNAAAHLASAELLDAVSQDIAGIYAARAGGDPAEWRTRMQAETWLGADEAVEAGLADRVASRSQSDENAAPLGARSWASLVAQWRAAEDEARPAAPPAATRGDEPCPSPEQPAEPAPQQLAALSAELPADAGPQTPAAEPVADAAPAPELPTSAVSSPTLSELVCSALRKAV